MHVGKVHTYGNISYHNEVINYYYQIKPINSLFASNTQKSTLLENMIDKILTINMPGAVLIKPKALSSKKIIEKYESNYLKYGKPEFKGLKDDMLSSIKKIIGKKINYRYEIYLMITDGREELKHKKPMKLFGKSNDPMPKRLLDISQVVNEEIYKKLSKDLSVEKLDEKQVEVLHNYMAVPLEKALTDYFVTPSPTELEYTYKKVHSFEPKKLYTRALVANKFKEKRNDDRKSNDVINALQLLEFPVDTFVKWDLEHTQKFKQNMSAKKEELKKQNKRYQSMADRNDEEAVKAKAIAAIGEQVDEGIEQSKIRWQMYFRIRANSLEMLNKRDDHIRERLRSGHIELSNEIGEQIKLADNLFPYRSSFKKYAQLTDISYFAQFNFLGGLYIGEEEEGMIITYTMPGELPIFYDISAPLLGKTKTNSSTTVYAGSTGSGKTQVADYETIQAMLFNGMRTLTIDPKGDRAKKVSMLGDMAAELKIGSPDNPDGMFDCYLMYQDDIMKALAKAKTDVVSLVRAVNPNASINLLDIDKAHDDMIKDYKNNIIKQLTFSYLVQKYEKYDAYNAQQLMSLARDPDMRLFFANEKTRIDAAFNLHKMYNLITFEHMPLMNKEKNIDDFNPNELEHRKFAVLFSRVSEVINSFMKLYGNEENILTFDEVRACMSIPGGRDIIDIVNRQGRSWMTHLRLISQSPSDIPDEILNNTGQMFIGSLASTKEIEFVLKELKLENHAEIKSVLEDNTTDEGVKENKKYTFLYRDYNNRKCITKLKIPQIFEDAFRTLKTEEVNES